MVLIHDEVEEVGHWQVRCLKVRHRLRVIECQREIVESQVRPGGLGNGHGILSCLQVCQDVVGDILFGLSITVEGDIPCNGADDGVVDGNGGRDTAIVGQSDRQSACFTIGIEGITVRITNREERLVEKVTTTVIPGEIIDLIQIVIVIGRRIMGCREILLADVERFVLTLCLLLQKWRLHERDK